MCLLEIEELVMEIILLFSVFAMLVFLTLNQKLYLLPEFIIRYVCSSRYGDYKKQISIWTVEKSYCYIIYVGVSKYNFAV